MNKSATNNSGTWRNVEATMNFFGSGRCTVEKIAAAAGAKRKIGRRVLFNVEKMSAWLDSQEGGEKTA